VREVLLITCFSLTACGESALTTSNDDIQAIAHDAALDATSSKFSELEGKIEELESELAQAQSKADQAQSDVDEAESAISTLKSEYEDHTHAGYSIPAPD
jgi:peptidoglycan hydrolase CwlO-like protein